MGFVLVDDDGVEATEDGGGDGGGVVAVVPPGEPKGEATRPFGGLYTVSGGGGAGHVGSTSVSNLEIMPDSL